MKYTHRLALWVITVSVAASALFALRDRARAALGDKFSIKAFHNTLLEIGNRPLDVLGQVVDAWIAAIFAAQ